MLCFKNVVLNTITSACVCVLCYPSDIVEREKYFSNEDAATSGSTVSEGSVPSYIHFCKDIRRRLENPSGDGNSLLKSMFSFYEDLRDLRNQLEANKTNVHCKTFYTALQQTNGPEYIQAELNFASLLKDYKWSNFDVAEVQELITDTQNVWDRIRANAERLGLDKM